MTGTAVLLFTADLRVHDNPALAAVADAPVAPLYVDDPGRRTNPNRRRFTLDAVEDLRDSLRALGADLVVRRGDTVAQVMDVLAATGATGVVCADDVGRFETDLRRRLAEACRAASVSFTLTHGPSVLDPGRVLPSGGGDHYKVFTPYWRAWSQARWREEAPEPARLRTPDLPRSDRLDAEPTAADLPRGGERAALARLDEWDPDGYGTDRDDLAADRTSRLSAHLAAGCLSARSLAADPRVPEAAVRQLCWRDFHRQVLAAFPALVDTAYRRGAADEWDTAPAALEAWRLAAPGSASWTRGCAGSPPKAGCTTAPASSAPDTSPARSASTGARAPSTSRATSSTSTRRTTGATGSGRRGPAATPGRTAASTTNARPPASTPTAPTAAAGARRDRRPASSRPC
ncbi:deoxyribodipyrimidine photo-lyase [Glycomyces paridis]|uniref:Deoxyribodipyrimidine photo-lyase n=1 Tax=Glycomyces paridis TaxID=2126555 RepID=A0A4S8P9Z9_9ACTN|nr:deoxyribodipyrimidine photo-lyase [Glycomyces paridis]THV27103.1 deoxyribodipyrimidine photo-lyase [Glycomyces paridis]